MASKLAPEAPEGCALRRFPHRCRICRGNGPAGAPEALLGDVRGAEPPQEDLNDQSTLLTLLEGRYVAAA
eukprot:9729773-Alexandrium_andersonii.AAC.1